MNRIKQSPDDLLRAWKEQLELLSTLANVYDAGNFVIAKSLATSLRVLLHSTKRSQSLIDLLGKKDINFLDTLQIREFTKDVLDLGGNLKFIGISSYQDGVKFVPYLDDHGNHIHGYVSFEDWWNRPVFVSNNDPRLVSEIEFSFTRRDLVIFVSNQDGGAHVNQEINENYKKLSTENLLKFYHSFGFSFPNTDINRPELAAIRQIAHEVLKSLTENYQHKSAGNNIFRGLALEIIEENVSSSFDKYRIKSKVGRNSLCPCGSNMKYKKCHGKLY